MRGCLFTLALLVVLAAAATWFVLPPLMGTLAQGALVAAGLSADQMTVSVSSDPPPELLGLRADRIRIQATDARYRGLEASDVDLTLRDVRLLDRTFGRIDGTLGAVTIPGPSGAPPITIPGAKLSGDAEEVRATLTIPAATVDALAAAAVVRAIGIQPSRVVVAAPDRVRIEAAGLAIQGRLAVNDAGALMLVPPAGAPLGAVAIVQPGPDDPWKVESFSIVDGDLTIVATLDVASD